MVSVKLSKDSKAFNDYICDMLKGKSGVSQILLLRYWPRKESQFFCNLQHVAHFPWSCHIYKKKCGCLTPQYEDKNQIWLHSLTLNLTIYLIPHFGGISNEFWGNTLGKKKIVDSHIKGQHLGQSVDFPCFPFIFTKKNTDLKVWWTRFLSSLKTWNFQYFTLNGCCNFDPVTILHLMCHRFNTDIHILFIFRHLKNVFKKATLDF